MQKRRGSKFTIDIPLDDDDEDDANVNERANAVDDDSADVATTRAREDVTKSGTFTVDEFRISKRGLGVSTVDLQALEANHAETSEVRASTASSASASASALGDDEFILGVDDLDFVDIVGTGSGGVVRLARHKQTREALAVKNIQLSLGKDVEARKRIITELRTLHKSSCAYIVRSRGAYFDQGSISILMEYMDGGTLCDATRALGRWHEEDLAAVTGMLVDGLHYLHSELKVVHRDIKPSNVLLNTSGVAKLSDFGVSGQLIDASKCHSWVGTVTYMSPERIQGESYEYSADVWSFALAIVECALGRFPYNPPDVSHRFSFWDLLDIVVKAPVPELKPELAVSDEFANFVALGLNKDPTGRMSARNMIAHPWIFGRDRPADARRVAALVARARTSRS